MKGLARRAALTAAWLAIAAILSLGAAGIAGSMTHQPGTPTRAELTYAGDQAIEPGLSAAEADLATLADEVSALGELGRGALGALVGRDLASLDATVADGTRLSQTIATHSEALRATLLGLPGVGSDAALVLSPEVRRRHALALRAIESTDGLADAWERLGAGALAATRVTVLLVDHDKTTGEAAAAGRAGKYPAALEKLTESDGQIAQARSLRDALAASTDVSTLTQWLDLNAAYDKALRNLYQSLSTSKGSVTPKVLAAINAEKVARAALPADTKGLVVILAEIGRGGLNQAVITIEEARGDLEAAVGLLTAEPDSSPADDGSGGGGGSVGSPAP
jgi:hypothetical protein